MFDLYDYSVLTIILIGLVPILGASEIGWRLGSRGDARGGQSTSTLAGAMLGLLALLIGFTFAMALSRFEARRDAVLHEANAIGATVLRARLLAEPHRSETQRLLREYLQLRLDIAKSGTSLDERKSVVDRSNVLQALLWQQAKAAVASDSGIVTGLFIQALNGMVDTQQQRLAAVRNRIPNMVLFTLFSLAAIAAGFAGYASGLEARRTRLPVYVMGVLVLTVILVILDLDRPSDGFITNNQQPMLDLAGNIAAFSD
jgi:hypothetical protein